MKDMKMKNIILVLLASSLSVFAFSNEPKHDDKAHEKAESNLDNKHWEKAHGNGVPDKKEGRKPGGKSTKKSSKKGVIKE